MDEEKKQKKHYNKKNNQYEYDLIINPPRHTRQEIGCMIKKLKKYKINKKRIIEYGSGAGRLTIPLLKNNFSVLAIDISDESLKNLEKRAKNLKLNGLKTAHVIPTDQKYEAVVGTDILHHVELDKYLPIYYKILNKGGKILFSEPNALNLSWYIYLPLFQNWEVEKGVIYNSYFNLINKLTKHGFSNIKITGLGLLPRPFFNFSERLCRLNDLLGNIPFLKLFAYRYIIEATK